MVTGHRHINSVVSRHWVVGTPKARVLKRPFTRIRAQRLNFGVDTRIACVAGFRRGGKRKRRASEAREDRTREDHGTFSLPRSFWLSSLPFYGLPRRLHRGHPWRPRGRVLDHKEVEVAKFTRTAWPLRPPYDPTICPWVSEDAKRDTRRRVIY